MRITVHPRIHEKRPDISDEDMIAVVQHPLRVRARAGEPTRWVGVGIDPKGRLLQFIASEQQDGSWHVYHGMHATKPVLSELGFMR